MSAIMYKVCNVCHKSKPFDEMVKSTKAYGANGCAPKCKECMNRLRRKNYPKKKCKHCKCKYKPRMINQRYCTKCSKKCGTEDYRKKIQIGLTDTYIRKVLKAHNSGLKQVPYELLELKRMEIKCNRLLKQLQK